MGEPRPSQGGRAGEERGGTRDAARAGAELGLVRAGGAGCGEDADCEREPDGAGGGAGPPECR